MVPIQNINFPDCDYVDGNIFACYGVPVEKAKPLHPAHFTGDCRYLESFSGKYYCRFLKPIQLEINWIN